MTLIPVLFFGVVIICWCGVLTFLFLQLKSSLQKITRDGKKETIIDLLSDILAKEKRMNSAVLDINKKVEGLIFDSQFYIQKIGLVRFNPFNDTGGDQSFILALIDAEESGVVVSGLHTRNGTRWYAKKVTNGHGVEHELSSDELKAIKAATKRSKK